MEYIDTEEFGRLKNLSPRRVCKLCEQGRIEGAKKFGNARGKGVWLIPVDAKALPPEKRKLKNG